MIRPAHLRAHVIEPVLRELELYSEAAVVLLLGTAAQESRLGTYLVQLGGGPAKGIYQCEKATHDDLFRNYLGTRKELLAKVQRFQCTASTPFDQLPWNLAYATAIARIHYLRVKEPMPPAHDLKAIGRYYKQYYNTEQGKATVDQFCANYRRYVTEALP